MALTRRDALRVLAAGAGSIALGNGPVEGSPTLRTGLAPAGRNARPRLPLPAQSLAPLAAYREERERFQGSETGYSAIQGTRPQSLALAQEDSPVGWLAWMLEKYWAWGDHGDDLWETFDRDDLLTTALLYWLPGRILSAARIYYESSNPVEVSPGGSGRVEVPTGYAHFPAEPWGPPRDVVERTYNLVHYSEMPRGGHFPALEQPELWSTDVARFFASI